MNFSSDRDESPSASAAEEARAKHLSPRAGQHEIHDAATEVDAPEHEPPFAVDETQPQRSEEAVHELAKQGLALVEPEARKVARQLGHLAEIDELISVGRGALFEAARCFDPERSSFGAYARKRMRWAMFDSVRRSTHGRSVAARAAALFAAERVLDAALSTPPDPTLSEGAHARRLREVVGAQAAAMALGLSAPYVAGAGAGDEASAGRSLNVAARAPEMEQRSPDRRSGPDAFSPEDMLMRQHCAVALRGALDRLPPKQREIVERHYFGDERFDHIAERLGISKSWTSRLHAQAMVVLYEALRDHH